MFSRFQLTVIVLESVVALAGLGIFAWIFFSPAGRAARARPPVLPAWRISRTDFLLFLWLVIAFGFFGQLALQFTAVKWLQAQPDGDTLDLMVRGSVFHFGAIAAWIILQTRERRQQQPPGHATEAPAGRVSARGVVIGVVLAFAAVIPPINAAGILSEYVLERAGLPAQPQELVDLFLHISSPALLCAMIAFALAIAPVSEELVFRAGLFRYLRTRAPRWVAFTASAALFALLHANLVSFLPLFVVGVVFSIAYERTGSIVTPMLAHALFNLNTLLLLFSGAGR